MKYLLGLICSFICLSASAQRPPFTVHSISLPKELEFYDNQFSGLAVSAGKLFLLSESRLQDRAEAKLYTLKLADLDRKLLDTTYVLPYQKLPLNQLPALRTKMLAARQQYEGLEAMLIDGNDIYFSVETATPSTNCYLLKGSLTASAVVMDTTFLTPLAKPLAADGQHIYNAGFEALAEANKQVVAFFEFNSFPGQNYAYALAKRPAPGSSTPLPFAPLPFRITDMTPTAGNHFTAINYFFKGGGGDAVYRTPTSDTTNTKLITDRNGFKSYCRLVDVVFKNNRFTWQPLWELPEQYWGYNWEGIAAYKNGYFIINDKYTPSRPYRTTLLYLQATR
ncbi:hypothetical protein ACFP2F_22335 [Hymenobacter artigasi]|uniref:Uncharacterized protein n=1 Tax=Hymenobacter artigasi TaxID=2719616 RepID=A0ABX1HNY9_9BACT|nr:hypothetical protein [Hymenobacter artigasi]NKI91969.1 hypothetical protein [Hymenobacter artigasi]